MKTAIVLTVLLLAAPGVFAQEMPRTGHVNCNNLPDGVIVTITLTWTQMGAPAGAEDTWTCSGDARSSHATVQPAVADGWELWVERGY